MPFGSKELYQFSKEWEFDIIASNPELSKIKWLGRKKCASNKNKLIKKYIDSNQDINLAMLTFGSAPTEQGLSPAQFSLSGSYDNKKLVG